MKYVVYSRFKTEVPYSKTICDNEETLATTIQYLRIDLVTSSVHENVEIRVFPYFEEGQMVLNIKTLQTRIVKAVMALEKEKLVAFLCLMEKCSGIELSDAISWSKRK